MYCTNRIMFTRLITMRSQPNYLRLFCFSVVVLAVIDVVFVVVFVLDVYIVV